MNMFDDAKIKEKINKIPFKYNVVRRGTGCIIKSQHIGSVEKDGHLYILSAFDVEDSKNITIYKDYIDFQLFVFDNFYYLTKVTTNLITRYSEYHLKNGLLHSTIQAAYKKYNSVAKLLESNYYMKGREVDEQLFKQLLREKKLSRI